MLSALLFFFELYHRFIFSLNAVLSELLFLAMKFSFVIYPSLFSETYLSYYVSIEVYLIPFRLVSLMSFPLSSMLTSLPIRLKFIFPFLFSLSLYLGRPPSFFLRHFSIPFSWVITFFFYWNNFFFTLLRRMSFLVLLYFIIYFYPGISPYLFQLRRIAFPLPLSSRHVSSPLFVLCRLRTAKSLAGTIY